MGWLFGHHTRASLVEHLKNCNGVKTIKNCFVGNNMWAVQEYQRTPTEKALFICLYMLQGNGRVKNDPCNWGYKDVSEDMGPYQLSCPLSYIELVETHEKEHGYETTGYAPAWRQSVRDKLALKKRMLPIGQHISLYDREYEVVENLGRKGYRIRGAEYGFMYLLKPSQVATVELLSCP